MEEFFIAGGDERLRYMGNELKDRGFQVIRAGDLPLKEAMGRCRYILGPTPFSREEGWLFWPQKPHGISITQLLSGLTKDHVVFGGQIPEKVLCRCRFLDIPCYDLMREEGVALKNAAATAEGAIAEAICQSPGLIHRSQCLILGFGRCGSCLARKLTGLDACVSICDRNPDRMALAWSMGCKPVPAEELEQVLSSFDFIFNTVPAPVLDAPHLAQLKSSAVILDLASLPGGIDLKACETAGIRAKLCPGLPGRFSPGAAAAILCEGVLAHI